uniref:RING-type domain-containing protein n=1 Tax=Athene cunicularia TaxID=194338 RepID=A0A663N339_ATHCN
MIPQGRFPQPTEVLIPVGVCSLPPACMLCGQAEPGAPGGSVGCGPAAATSCALPRGTGLAGEALRLPLTGLLFFQQCFVCGESGAAITCCREGCDRSFHLPCAMEGECVTQYFLPHRSFCREHRPEQEVEAAPDKDTTCIICRGPVEDRKSFHTMVCPICREAWFHQGCIQYAGTIAFRCPVCRDQYDFLHGMLTVGIRIPGRPWELLLCSSCAAEGTHRRCANLSTSRSTWECGLCAGQGTGKSTIKLSVGLCPGTFHAHLLAHFFRGSVRGQAQRVSSPGAWQPLAQPSLLAGCLGQLPSAMAMCFGPRWPHSRLSLPGEGSHQGQSYFSLQALTSVTAGAVTWRLL